MSFFKEIGVFDDKIALLDEKEYLTYSQLVEDGDKIAQNLKKRSLVIILCRNMLEAIVGYVGFLRNDIVPILISSDIEDDLLDNLAEKYRVNAIYSPLDRWKAGEKIYLYGNYALFATNTLEIHSLNEELGVLLTTSGSTGSPKLVRQSYKNIGSNTASIIDYLKITDHEKTITMLPMQYTYGLSIIQTHLSSGASIFCTTKTFLDREIWDIFRDQKITSFGAVPYTYEVLKKIGFTNMDLPSLRYITQAGGKLDRDLHLYFADQLEKAGKKFVVMYGATEATARMSYLPSEKSIEKAGSIGKAIPGGRFEIVDTEGQIIETPDVEGELVYYGENVTLGYSECIEDLCKGDERNGRYVTGDIAKFDKDGYYYIVGRKSRFLKMFGNRINLFEVEKMLSNHGWEAVCVGEDNDMSIFTTDDDVDGIRSYLSQKLRLHMSSITVEKIQEIPRNSAGKVLYSELGRH